MFIGFNWLRLGSNGDPVVSVVESSIKVSNFSNYFTDYAVR
jgi:hypothetical protein